MFEHRRQLLLSSAQFTFRVARYIALASLLLVGSLALGTAGYHHYARLAWIDAFLNASMILTGMGPIAPMASVGAKLFASFYAIFSGVVFLAGMGLVVAPLFHRFLHKFHLESND